MEKFTLVVVPMGTHLPVSETGYEATDLVLVSSYTPVANDYNWILDPYVGRSLYIKFSGTDP